MSANQPAEKLRHDIKAKLAKLGAHVDAEELVDYIMLMLANQRERSQIRGELSLFLKQDTDPFVEWLCERAKDVPFKSLSITATTTTNKSSGDSESSKNKNSDHDRRTVHSRESDSHRRGSGLDVRNKVSQDERVSSTNRRKIYGRRRRGRNSSNDNTSYEASNSYSKSYDNDVKHEEYSPRPILKEEELDIEQYRPEDQEVVLHLRNDDNNEFLGNNDEPVFELDKDERPGHQHPMIIDKRYSRLGNRENYGITSTIGAIVRHDKNFTDTDEDENNTRYNVSSVVTVSERISSVPKNLQASSKLVLKAMQDANTSIGREREYSKRKLDDFEIPYKPTPIKRRLGRKITNDSFEENYDDYEENNSINSHFQSRYYENTYEPHLVNQEEGEAKDEMDEEYLERRQSPRFIVTLDGAAKLARKERFERYLCDDELLFAEEMDEEFQENDDSIGNRNRMDGSDSGRVKERCKYWPSCKKGNRCPYIHPTNPCRTFPNCKFGEKCLFIHPDCKFDALCTRSDCPYTHSSKRTIPLIPAKPPAPTFCRFNSSCMNPTCPFIHPKPCNFGVSCRNPSCPFTHPPSFNPFKTLPKPHQLKWKSNNERKFAIEGPTESMDVAIEKLES